MCSFTAGRVDESQVWKGWKPFRMETCLFELRHSGLLKENRRVERRAETFMDLGEKGFAFEFCKHERRVVSYEEAEIRVIYHGMNLMRKSLQEDMNMTECDFENPREDLEESTEQKLLETAEALSERDSGAVERAVLMYEAAAGEFGSEQALEKGSELIVSSASISDFRIENLIEMFIGEIIPPIALKESMMNSRTEMALRGAVLRTCRRAIGLCKARNQGSPLTNALLLISRFGERKERGEVVDKMEVELCCSQKYGALEEYSQVHDVMFYMKKRSGSGAQAGIQSGTRNAKERASTDGRRDPVLGGDIILGEGCLGASSLAPQYLRYSRELFELAAWKGERTSALVWLGYLLLAGAKGVLAGAPRAVELYERAIA